MTELITYDSLRINPMNKYEIYDERSSGFRCRWTHYYEDGLISQEFWLKKQNKEEINYNYFEQTFMMYISGLQKNDEFVGYADGVYQMINANSQPLVTGKLQNKEMIDLWTYYYYDQDVKIEVYPEYNGRTSTKYERYFKLNGELYSGNFAYYDNENEIIEKRAIKYGLRNGKTVYIDSKTGKKTKTEKYENGELSISLFTNKNDMSEVKKRYYEEMAKKANEPIIIKHTEYTYIVPQSTTKKIEDKDFAKDLEAIIASIEFVREVKQIISVDSVWIPPLQIQLATDGGWITHYDVATSKYVPILVYRTYSQDYKPKVIQTSHPTYVSWMNELKYTPILIYHTYSNGERVPDRLILIPTIQ